jgi:hypothetical protein
MWRRPWRCRSVRTDWSRRSRRPCCARNVSDINLDSSASGEGLGIGALIGYKELARVGFTFVAQGGVHFGVIQAEATDATVKQRKVFPLLNLNLGWSF